MLCVDDPLGNTVGLMFPFFKVTGPRKSSWFNVVNTCCKGQVHLEKENDDDRSTETRTPKTTNNIMIKNKNKTERTRDHA